MKPDRKQLVWVEWQDAVGDSSRIHYEDIKSAGLSINHNLGWVIDENDRRIILAHGYTGAGEVDFFAIPKVDILSMTPAAYTPRKKKVVE